MCDEFASKVLLPDALLESALGPSITARAVHSLIATSLASGEACAVAAARKLPAPWGCRHRHAGPAHRARPGLGGLCGPASRPGGRGAAHGGGHRGPGFRDGGCSSPVTP